MTHLYDQLCMRNPQMAPYFFDPLAIPICSMYRILSNIYLHLAQIYGKCRQIFHAWSIWDMDDLRAMRVTTEPPNIHLCNGTIGGEVPNFGGLTQPTHVQSPMQVVSFKMWMWMMRMFRSFTELETIYLFASFTPPPSLVGFLWGPMLQSSKIPVHFAEPQAEKTSSSTNLHHWPKKNCSIGVKSFRSRPQIPQLNGSDAGGNHGWSTSPPQNVTPSGIRA